MKNTNNVHHLGTLGTGNHFIEVCLDEQQNVWIMLHSGSRGVGNRIGTWFIEQARKDMETHQIQLPDKDLAYLREGTEGFDDYVEAVGWAQRYARINRQVMMRRAIGALRSVMPKSFEAELEAVNCHHNYVNRETHYGQDVLLTRKGAVSARKAHRACRSGRACFGSLMTNMATVCALIDGVSNGQIPPICQVGPFSAGFCRPQPER